MRHDRPSVSFFIVSFLALGNVETASPASPAGAPLGLLYGVERASTHFPQTVQQRDLLGQLQPGLLASKTDKKDYI